MRSFTGFTLIELLTVIAIIAVLGAIAFAGIGRIRHAAQTTQSLNNLRQIHLLMQNYVIEHKYIYPAAIASSEVFQDQAGFGVYWRRTIWEAQASSNGSYWDPNFPGDAYNKLMWCPLMVSEHGNVNFKEGHGSYALHQFFHTNEPRNALTMTHMGKKVPYIFAGNAATDTPEIGTHPYGESSAYPYDTRWSNLAYVYGSSRSMALGVFLDGSVRLIDQASGTAMNALFKQRDTLP
ncbi:MAG: type II secretion system protein [Verrucomicrobiota bacterium]